MPELLRFQDDSIIMVDASSELINIPVYPLARIEQREVASFRYKMQGYLIATEHFGLSLVNESEIGPFMVIELRVKKEIEITKVCRKQMKLFPLPEMKKTNQINFVSKPWEIIAAARELGLRFIS